ncbi:hypothetical protein MUP01_02275 [Candidatus Bathyarchaeota archaeon]|nr:hypothetical protein [Candidatus Bathyarchaeota archaeon]
MLYYVKQPRGETIDDAVKVPGKPDEVREAAESAVQDLFDNRDGWEIAFHNWPVTIVVIDDEGQEWKCEVNREDTPYFYSEKPKKVGAEEAGQC